MSQTAHPDVLDRYVPTAGILAVVAFVGGIVFESTGPAPSDSPATLASKFASDQAGVLAGSHLLMIGIALFAVFLAVLRSALRQAEGASGTLSTLTFGVGLLGLVSSTTYVAIYGSLAHGVASAGGPSLTFALLSISNAIDSISGVFFGLAALAAAAVILWTAAFPHWLGWLALVSGGLGALGAAGENRVNG